MVEAQEVEPLRTPGEVHDPRLLGMQLQPERPEGRRDQLAGRFGLLVGRAEDDEVVGISGEHSQSLPLALPRLIEHVQVDVRQKRRDDCSHAMGNFEFERSIRRPGRRNLP